MNVLDAFRTTAFRQLLRVNERFNVRATAGAAVRHPCVACRSAGEDTIPFQSDETLNILHRLYFCEFEKKKENGRATATSCRVTSTLAYIPRPVPSAVCRGRSPLPDIPCHIYEIPHKI